MSALAGAVALALVVVGCTGGDGEPATSPTTSAAPPSTSSPSPTEHSTPSEVANEEQTEDDDSGSSDPQDGQSGEASGKPADGSSGDGATSESGGSSGDGATSESGGSSGADEPSAQDDGLGDVTIPDSWQGTILTTPTASSGDGIDVFFYEGMFHGNEGMLLGTITADDVMDSMTMSTMSEIGGQEFQPESCTGSTTANTADAISCTLRGATGTVLNVSMRAVPTPYGHPGLVVHVTDKSDASFALPAGTAFNGEARMASSASEITEESAAAGLAQTIIVMWDHEGDGSMPLPTTECELRDGGVGMICSATGTPDGKADGTYVGAVQPSWDGTVGIIFGRLPAT